MRQPERPDDADNPLRLCYTGPSPTEERQLEIERRFGIEIVCGYALSETPYGLIWPHGTRPFGTLGSRAPAPELGHVNDGARRRRRRDGRGRRGRRAGAAQPGDHARLLRDARGDRGGPARRRLAAHRRPRDATTATAPTRSSAARRRSSAGAARTSRPPRWRRCSSATPTSRGRGDRRAVRAVRGGRQGVRRRSPASAVDLAEHPRLGGRAARALQGAALRRGGRRAAAHADRAASPSTSCRATAPPTRPTSKPRPDRPRR